MKNKYERMSKEEKKELINQYKIEKDVFYNKMKKMFILCYIGIIYGVGSFCYDFFYKNSKLAYVLDIIVLIFCLLALFKVSSIKNDLLNKFALKKDKERKKEVLKKYKK